MADSYWTYRYVGPRLQDLYDERPLREAMQRMANTGGDRLHAIIADLTPIKTGNLATSWDRHNARRELHGTSTAYVSRVETSVDYAPFVEHGTGLWGPEHRKYLIKPIRRARGCRGSIRSPVAAPSPARCGTLGAPVGTWSRTARR